MCTHLKYRKPEYDLQKRDLYGQTDGERKLRKCFTRVRQWQLVIID